MKASENRIELLISVLAYSENTSKIQISQI